MILIAYPLAVVFFLCLFRSGAAADRIWEEGPQPVRLDEPHKVGKFYLKPGL